MDVLCGLIAKEMVDKEARQAKLSELAPKFDTREEALSYARRIVALKPGDRVFVPSRDADGLWDAVYVGSAANDSSCVKLLAWDAETGRLAVQATSLALIVLP